jgi:L-iditol 2-dehydrogenase
MKAALLFSPGSLSVEEFPRPICPQGGALIKVEACTLCASDVKMWSKGHRDLSYPRILGHEVVGEVKETKSPLVKVGSRVQVWPGVACGHCVACLRGMDNQCTSMGVIGFNQDGGLAEYMAIPSGCVERGGTNPLHDGMPSDLASLTEPLACCINAQTSVGVGSNDSVMVIGGGPLGAMNLMLARHRKAMKTILVERDGSRAHLICHYARPDAVLNLGSGFKEALSSETGGHGVDVIIIATSEPLPISELIDALAPRGRLSLFSGFPNNATSMPIDLNRLHYLERSMVGSYGCRSTDCREALRLLSNREVDADWLITKRFQLSGIVDALRYVARKEGMKATMIG